MTCAAGTGTIYHVRFVTKSRHVITERGRKVRIPYWIEYSVRNLKDRCCVLVVFYHPRGFFGLF
jgi:hypothetical protein